jgi:signal transduction histidine kinase
MRPRPADLARRPHLPRRTVRLRLTLLYGGLFLASGVALLGITYLLVVNSTGQLVHVTGTSVRPAAGTGPPLGVPSPALQNQAAQLRAQADQQRTEQLHQLLVQSGIALGLMAVASVGLGWIMAGRVLRPLRVMTATTRRISERNLHQRLAVTGPSDELKDLGDTIDELLARLDAAFEAQRRFVANASHELRTPLSMMRTSLDVAAGKPGPRPPGMAALDAKLREGLNRADRLVEDFLTLARAQRGALPEQTTVSLPGITAAAIDRRAELIAERRIRLRQQLNGADLIGSPTLLAHMVGNVVDNAIRHNEPSGWIRVHTQLDDDWARLTVENGGPRLGARAVAELAQPFRRLGVERTSASNGSGLGLSIVAAIVDAHGGRLELHARSEGGLQVRIELPRAGDRLASGVPS